MTANQYLVYSIADERHSAYGAHVDHLYLLSMFTLGPTLKTPFKYMLLSSWSKLSSFDSLSFSLCVCRRVSLPEWWRLCGHQWDL